MVRSQKSKRVSWPSDVNLCQIRLFLSEDSPSQVGFGAQDNLQVKASWLLHSTGVGADDQLPPGFEGSHSTDQVEKEVPQIALVKWQFPPRFVPNPHWRVVAGEESREAEFQKQREMRVLEAIYPRPSAIPPSPCVSPEVEISHFENKQIPLIPVTPIEDEDVTTSSPTHAPVISQPQPQTAPKSVPGVEPDVVAAASAAFTAIMKSNEQGSLIDQELLIKILNNPKLIEKLVTDYGATTPPVVAPPAVVAAPPLPPVKDINYYKSLIQQHGGENSEMQQQQQQQQQFGKSRVKRACIYFNSSRGCKHGANCAFPHDISVQQNQNRSVVSVPAVQSGKRMKVERELTGI